MKTTLTAREIATVSGGANELDAEASPQGTPGEDKDYPQNPAGPVTIAAPEKLFNRK